MQEKTKILYLITGLETGGAEVLLRGMNRKLDKDAYDIKILSLTSVGEIGKQIQKEGGDVSAVGAGFKYNPLNFFKLVRFVRERDPDILHAHLFHANLLGRLAGKICRVPVIISTIHNVDFGGRLREKLLRLTDFMGTVTVAISGNVGNAMLERKVVPEKKLRVIDNGIDVEEFKHNKDKRETRSSLGIEEDKFVMVAVGRLAEQKGYPYLFEALKTLQEEDANFELLLLGDGEDREKLEELSREKGLDKNVSFLGNRDNVRDYFAVGDLFVMPSLWEGLPLALLEAMASGLPVAATNVGGVPEVMEDGESGFLVEPRDAGALAERIAHVLNMSEEERRKMGECGRRIVEERFSVEKMTDAYVELYEGMLENIKNKQK